MDLLSATGKVTKALEGLTKDDAKRVLNFAIDCVERGPEVIPLPARAVAAATKKAGAAPSASGEASAN